MGTAFYPGTIRYIERDYTDGTARQLGLRAKCFPARTRDELASSVEAMAASPARALSIFCDRFAVANRRQILDFAIARNLKTANATGLKLPQSLLVRADRLIS